MIPAPYYNDLKVLLNDPSYTIKGCPAPGLPLGVKTIGFILFDQNYERANIKDLLCNLDSLNLHTGFDIHFLLCGASWYGKNDPKAIKIGTIEGASVYHSARAVKSYRDEFSKKIPGFEDKVSFQLVLVDVQGEPGSLSLDFPSGIYFNIDDLIKANVVDTPTDLINKFVEVSRKNNLANAASFREDLKVRNGTNWLKEMVLSIFPPFVERMAKSTSAIEGPVFPRKNSRSQNH